MNQSSKGNHQLPNKPRKFSVQSQHTQLTQGIANFERSTSTNMNMNRNINSPAPSGQSGQCSSQIYLRDKSIGQSNMQKEKTPTKKEQAENIKVPDISGLSISLSIIQKKNSLNSEASRKDSKDQFGNFPLFGGMPKVHSNSPTKQKIIHRNILSSPSVSPIRENSSNPFHQSKQQRPSLYQLQSNKQSQVKGIKKGQINSQQRQQRQQPQANNAQQTSSNPHQNNSQAPFRPAGTASQPPVPPPPFQVFTQQADGEQQIQQRISSPINWYQLLTFLRLSFFTYQFNLIQSLSSVDSSTTQLTLSLLKIAPGYKPIQYIYTFYSLKYTSSIGLLAALLYPLPYSLLFLLIPIDFQVPFVAIFMLAGMRSGAVALLAKYCLHFPKHIFHWIVFIFTCIVGTFFSNNYIYLLLFGISIFLSFYLNHSPSRNSISLRSESLTDEQEQPRSALITSNFGLNFNEEQIYKQYQVIDNLPETYPNVSLCILIGSVICLWILQRCFDNRQLQIFGQIIPISLLYSSKQMLAFFPYIHDKTIPSSTLSPSTFISLSFLFPGPHSKVFMFFILRTQFSNVIIIYLCLYLPSILLTNIFIAYRHYFYTRTYYNIRQSIQAVGNGIVLCLVVYMLKNQPCFFNSVCYSAVVIMVVAKLYKLRELFAILLGIFLISIRTIILQLNKGISFQKQACLVNQTLLSGNSSFINQTIKNSTVF